METLSSFLKNLFPFKGYKFFLLDCQKDIIIYLQSRRKCGFCPKCGKRCNTIEFQYERDIRDLKVAGKDCFLRLKQKKIRCKCGYRGVEKLDFVAKSSRITKRLEHEVVDLCMTASLKDVAKSTGLDWKTVKHVDFNYLKTLIPKKETIPCKRIAIDEIAIAKGHTYVTIIRDYDSGIPLKIFPTRTYENTAKALRELGKDRLLKIEYACLDMWDPFIKAITEYCPNAKIVFDKFHVVKKVNEALDNVRRKEFADASPEERKSMKHKRCIILKREYNLDQEQKEDLATILNQNNKLFKAYLLKEQIFSIFENTQIAFHQVLERLKKWFENILNSELEEFFKVSNMMQRYSYGIENYFRYGMTNAISEGFNNKINVLKRRAFGFRDIEYFMLKIYQNSMQRLA